MVDSLVYPEADLIGDGAHVCAETLEAESAEVEVRYLILAPAVSYDTDAAVRRGYEAGLRRQLTQVVDRLASWKVLLVVSGVCMA